MTTFITNLKNMGTTQRRLDFNSLCKIGDKWVFANNQGLFEIGGADDDNGTDIDAFFEPITTDFGIPNPKRARYLYIGFESSGELEIDVSFDGKPAETIRIFPDKNKTGQQRVRVTVSRKNQGRYVTIQVRNVDGCDFSIDHIAIDFYVLSRGHRDY